MSFGRSEFVDLTQPLHERLSHWDATSSPHDQPKNDAVDPAKAAPQGFIDAMYVRQEVFVKEQNIPMENEFDSDDPRSFHWVAYASVPNKFPSAQHGDDDDPNSLSRVSTSTKIPIGTIRLVPPPHPRPAPGEGPKQTTKYNVQKTDDEPKEAYIKLGRLAVIKEFRKAGISKLLVETALAFARENPYEVEPQLDPASLEYLKKGKGLGVHFKGLVLIHAQIGVQKVWRRFGFEVDESMGTWDEEGIEHVGMWRKLDVADARQKGIIRLNSGAGLQ